MYRLAHHAHMISENVEPADRLRIDTLMMMGIFGKVGTLARHSCGSDMTLS